MMRENITVDKDEKEINNKIEREKKYKVNKKIF